MFTEDNHPRDGDGKFTDSENDVDKTIKAMRKYSDEPEKDVEQSDMIVKQMTKEQKIASVHIDFGKDNVLPELNATELMKIGAKVNKPILVKKSIIDRNVLHHNDAIPDTDMILGKTLYEPTDVFHGKSTKDYFTFIKPLQVSTRNGKDDYGVVLLDITESNKNFEVVHWHWINSDKLGSLQANKKD